jgi:hypothetical protein
VQEGAEEVARKLPRVDVVLVVSSVRAKRGRSGGTMARPSGVVDRTAGAAFWWREHEEMEKNGLGSFSGVYWCRWSMGLWVWGGGDG